MNDEILTLWLDLQAVDKVLVTERVSNHTSPGGIVAQAQARSVTRITQWVVFVMMALLAGGDHAQSLQLLLFALLAPTTPTQTEDDEEE